MKVAVLGAGGQLGSEFVKQLGDEAVPLYHSQPPAVDVCAPQVLMAVFEKLRPSWVVNTAAFHNVDECERSPEKAFMVNTYGALNVARAASAVGARVVYISTDYVFGDKGPWYPHSVPDPLNVYGVSKYAGEILTHLYCKGSVVIRTASLFGKQPPSKGRNFVETMLALSGEDELEIVNDLTMQPTYAPDLAAWVIQMMRVDGFSSIHHITNCGPCTWFEFAQEIFKQVGVSIYLRPCSSRSRDLARRPKNSVLLEGGGVAYLRPWREALRDYLKWREQVRGAKWLSSRSNRS